MPWCTNPASDTNPPSDTNPSSDLNPGPWSLGLVSPGSDEAWSVLDPMRPGQSWSRRSVLVSPVSPGLAGQTSDSGLRNLEVLESSFKGLNL